MRLYFLFGLLFSSIFSFAAESHSKKYVDEPTDCFEVLKLPCAVRFISRGGELQTKGLKFIATLGTSLALFEGLELQILEGQVWLQSEEIIKIKSGPVVVKGRGDLWIQKNNKNYTEIKNLAGEFQVENNTFITGQTLPTGFENWYDGVNSDGKLNQGVLKPIHLKDFFIRWNRMTGWSQSKSRPLLESYKKSWSGSVQASADLYQEVVERNLASLEEKENQRQRSLQKIENERKALRRMYREKNYLESRD